MSSKSFRRVSSKMTKKIMRSYKLRIPPYTTPLRFRPWFLLFTSIVVGVLSFLGFTNLHSKLPLPDKVSHSIAFFVATVFYYFIIDVDESSRRIWFWRHFGVLSTVFICHFCGGVLIEIIQAVLPFKKFELGDVLANLLGATLGLWAGFHLERYYRHRKEISRLYRPLSATVSEFEEDEEDDEENQPGVHLLPTHVNHKASRLTDVWDEREELFGIGEESDEEEEGSSSKNHGQPQTPKIVISQS